VLLGIGSYIFTLVKPGATTTAKTNVLAKINSTIGHRRLLDVWVDADEALTNQAVILRLAGL
jgi:hypothetical protein